MKHTRHSYKSWIQRNHAIIHSYIADQDKTLQEEKQIDNHSNNNQRSPISAYLNARFIRKEKTGT